MKKIMQINITCGVGSTGRLSATLYHASQTEDYEARFAFSAYKPTLATAFRIESKLQNAFRRGLNKYFGRKQKHSSSGTRRLIRYIKKEQPNLIHLHNVQQNSVNYLLLFDFLKKAEIPVVFTLHDCWSFTGGCYHFTKQGCSGYTNGCAECPVNTGFDDVTSKPENSYAAKAELIGGNDNIYPVCVSKWLCKVATESYMGRMKNTPTVVYNGIDTLAFSPRKVDRMQKCGAAENEFVILGVASYWNENKGLSLFKEIAKRADFPLKIILIGGGLDSARSLGDDRFICIDRTESLDELAEYYSLADVFVNTSLEETFGLTTAEALACGTPAIVFGSTACPEIIDESTGICVPFDIERLMDAVKTVRNNGKNYYSQHCRERAEAEFSKEKMIENYFHIYRSILNGK